MWATASSFVTFTEKTAEWGFLLASVSVLSLMAIYLRSRVVVNPESAYRAALARLSRSPGVERVLGAPLAGSQIRAYLLTGGHPILRGLVRPAWRSQRCHMVFPVSGSLRKGLVSVECKKVHGQLVFKVLALDVPSMVDGAERRMYLVGGPDSYGRGGVLRELRDPFLRVLMLDEDYDQEDALDEEEEEEREEEVEHVRRMLAVQEGRPLYFGDWVAYWCREGYRKFVVGGRGAEGEKAPTEGKVDKST